jgi:hypothetical protein
MADLSVRSDLVKRRGREIRARIAAGRKGRSRRELAAAFRRPTTR